MIEKICDIGQCTACTVCRDACPREAIYMTMDSVGNAYPHIDYGKCVECKKCIRVCPANNPPELRYPLSCYVGWSNDTVVRHCSASGGIATELYRYFLRQDGLCAGVEIDGRGESQFVLFDSSDSLHNIQGSKYTYSNPDGIYKKVSEAIMHGCEVLFIGLPCHVAGLRSYMGQDTHLLTCVDLVCHGVASPEYLKQHISHIEHKKQKESDKLTFRDPRRGTNRFYFSLFSRGTPFYSKPVYDSDVYQIAYHSALIYRPNCYACQYALPERLGDLTIGDFSGLGRVQPFKGDKYNVNCILVNTLRGQMLLKKLQEYITLEERPISEALEYEKQLKQPSIPHTQRARFLEMYAMTRDFEQSAKRVLKSQIKHNIIRKNLHIDTIKRMIVYITPSKLRTYVKSKLRR